MSRPALVLLTTSYPRAADGSEAAGSFVAELAEELAHHVPVRVVAPGACAAIEGDRQRLCVFRYPAPKAPLSTLRPWHPGEALAILRVLRAGEAATEAALGAGPAAHLLALWALPSGHWAARCGRRHGVPYSVWALGSDVWSLGRLPLVRGRLRRVLRGASHRFADGMALTEQVARLAGRPAEFLPSAGRAAALAFTPPRAEPPYRLLYLARLHPNKGPDLLLAALERLADSDWARIEHLTLIGDGPLGAALAPRIAALTAAGRPVRALGFRPKTEALAELAASDWLLIPSRIESIPLVYSDALRLGRPVIATPVGDLPRLVAAQGTGLCAAAATPEAFAAALARALGESARAFHEAALRAARAFDPAAVAARLLDRLALQR